MLVPDSSRQLTFPPPQNITVSHKSHVVLDCVSTTNEGSYWINETGVMSDDVRMPLNGSLIIPSASQTDNGCYICELRGVSGVVSTKACITVLIPPFFYISNDVETNVSLTSTLFLMVLCRKFRIKTWNAVWMALINMLYFCGHCLSFEWDLIRP